MLIGEVASSTGLKTSAIRFYEREGIVPRAVRNAAGHRDFTEPDVDLLRFVRRLRALNIPLDEVREVVSLRSDGVAPCQSLRAALARGVSHLDREIQELVRVRDQLRSLRIAADRVEDDWPDRCVCSLVDSDSLDPAAGPAVEVTLQYFEGCPNWELVDRRLRDLGVAVRHRRIDTLEEAIEYDFRGSPTILVNGADPFHDPGAQISLACRVYRGPAGPAGAPSVEDLKEVIEVARKESSVMPTVRPFR